MADIIYHVAASLDGYIATPDGGVAWLSPFESAGTDHGFADFFSSLDGLLFGRRTYEQAVGFGTWPFRGKPCWVLSRTAVPPAFPEVEVTAATPADVVAALGARGLRRVWLVGGAALAASFRSAGLITEYAIAVVPIVLGAGIPLFATPGPQERLRLLEARPYPTGIVLLRYRHEEPAPSTSVSSART